MKNVLLTATLLLIGTAAFAQDAAPVASCMLHEQDLATGKVIQDKFVEFTSADNKNNPKIPVNIFEVQGTKVRFEYAPFQDVKYVVLKAYVGATVISTSGKNKAQMIIEDGKFVTSINCQ
ncbi:hypothetical protein [Bdellovibrio sp. KM01]|uniref:hypothetical protein n=1 Tax=Bdellovibrio sp. KM01 TaxID=2748865 RepID=UPI0015EAE316|nr:hypothetical protein [Bdellovibrio sp. KM01]QLY24647.1 hypothetical protein HW988_14475 [Bdellovibrio sp. KM01]